MGIGIVLLIWIALLLGLSKLGAVILRAIAKRLTRDVGPGRERLIRLAGWFPYVVVIWIISVFIFQAFINASVFHHDIGLGDSWETPLPNGYALLLIDDTDNGTVYNPKTQSADGGVAGDLDDAIGSVGQLQLAGPYILGAVEQRQFKGFSTSGKPDSFFLLDTRKGHHLTFANKNTLREAARRLGIRLVLEPMADVFSRYRYTWFDKVVVWLLFFPPTIAAIGLVISIIRLRRNAALV